MSYIALARKWRPQNFNQLVGQDHVNRTLINSLDQQRLHHAYLFTGTRGVGKTSVARLLAKALNCEKGITSNPCLQCDACVAIEQGRFVDLIEIDAASKTRVEDTRELLENVQYATSNARFKIYLIDEVHMLSQHSFNALLKTLEEPPSHVKFLLATTDPQKLPITVLSRCLQFNLKHLTPDIIASQLQHIMKEEGRSCSEEALLLIAKAARGSMRDALSILDQVLVSTDQTIAAPEVKAVLGYTQQDYAIQLLKALINQDPATIVTISRQIASEGGHFNYVLDEMIHDLHEITLHQTLPAAHSLLLASSDIQMLATQISPNDTQLFYQIALKGAQDMMLAPTLPLGFEMTLLRMLSFRPIPQIQGLPSQASPKTEVNEPIKSTLPHHQTPIETKAEIVSPHVQTNEPTTWEHMLSQLKLTGLARTAVDNAALVSKNDHELVLSVHSGHESLFTPSTMKRIEDDLFDLYQKKIKITIQKAKILPDSPAQQKQQKEDNNHKHAEKSLRDDPFLKKLEQTFSAEMDKNSISFHKDEL